MGADINGTVMKCLSFSRKKMRQNARSLKFQTDCG
jgi:hypothetical protein